ncbi:MAG TPA: hypothetical protein VK875_12330 [Euzebyales bacterium]|nr:hypothetical protein [Euzebyales bacterium]
MTRAPADVHTLGDRHPLTKRHAVRYQFLVREQLSKRAGAAFPELTVTPGPVGGTILYGDVRDEAALHGLLARFATMGLKVIEMRQLPD